MSLHVFVFCDRCSADSRVSQKISRQEGRGWCEGDRNYALGLGWVRRWKEDICPECLDEPKPENRKDFAPE